MGPKSLADWLPTVLLPPPSVRNRIGDTMRIGLLEPISGIYGSYAAGEEASAYCKGNHLTGSPRNACAYLHLGVRALLLEEKLLYPRKSRWAMSELRGSSPKGEFNPTIT